MEYGKGINRFNPFATGTDEEFQLCSCALAPAILGLSFLAGLEVAARVSGYQLNPSNEIYKTVSRKIEKEIERRKQK